MLKMLRSTKAWVAVPAVALIGAFVTYEYYRWQRKQKPYLNYLMRKCRQIIVVSTIQEWEAVEPLIKKDTEVLRVLGFDLEWVSLTPDGGSCMNPVSLMQLATHTGLCVLVRLHLLPEIPAGIKAMLRDRGLLKLGVAVYEDGVKLHKDYGLCMRGCVDLRYIAMRDRYTNFRKGGLATLSYLVLNLHMDKDRNVRRGNWEAPTLSKRQIDYGALDALVGVQIFMSLVKNRLRQHKGEHTEGLLWSKALSVVQGVVDVKFKSRYSREASSPQNKPKPNTSKPAKDTSRAYMTRQKPLYHNCQLWAPDGQMLCTCDISKAQWYLDKGLGEKVQDDPFVVRLNFEPSGRPMSERNYYLQDKENICVVCGSADSYIRKNVIPHEYRKYFPPVVKDHRSHDVLLLCTPCHQQCSQYDAALRQHFADHCDIPVCDSQFKKVTQDPVITKVKSAAKYFPSVMKDHRSHDVLLMCTPCHQQSSQHDSVLRQHFADRCNAPICENQFKFSKDPVITKVKSAAKALLTCSEQLPNDRRIELETAVIDYYGGSPLSVDLLQEAVAMDNKVPLSDYTPHGELVIKHMMENNGLVEFEQIWRQNFLDTMQPKFMPPLWAVDHGHEPLTELMEDMAAKLGEGTSSSAS